MAIERQVQRKLVDHIVSELGYQEVLNSTVGHNLIIESDVLKFLNTPNNLSSYKKVLRSYSGNVGEFVRDYCQALAEHVYQGHNVAIKMRKGNFTFKFKDETFYLFYPSGSSLSDLSDHNIHSVVEELRYERQSSLQGESYKKRFDLCFFINGIFFSMMELKHITSGQGIRQAQEQVLGNYYRAIDHYYADADTIPTDDKVDSGYRDFIKPFESSIHVVISDLSRTQVSRSLRNARSVVREALLSKKGSLSLFDNPKFINLIFNDLPLSDGHENNLTRAQEMLNHLYSKQSVERELLFYNYLEYNTKGYGQKLISPRPKQKFGVDKTIDRIIALYKNENDPDFIANEMASKLRQRGYSEDQVLQEVNSRKLLTNNGKIYSILKQYAAGFGKTKIMSWEAIMLNEMMHPLYPKEKLFNKIILLSDRIDLKQQMASAMKDMPTIENGAWDEADTVDEFIKQLSNPVIRIVVVNVQKFNWISGRLNKQQEQLCSTLRIAFIIDEIHRSHNGTQNEQMQKLFNSMGNMAGSKKNLLVGLTATVSDNILRRFGEVALPSSSGLEFVPFDAFTMREAIQGGYVLDPLVNFIPIHVPVFIESMDKFATDSYRMPSGADIYIHEDYIHHVTSHAYKILKAKTFGSIRGRGKAMYVADSVDSAIDAFHAFKALIESDSAFENEADRPMLCIVYSDANDQNSREKAIRLNNGIKEKNVIEAFKLAKNAIIVVVEKLQTGFDEPTLHTLILNTERKGIEMVQTLCRVNRTASHKRDCVIIDYSLRDPKTGKSKNELNAEDAFAKYAGINKTVFNVAKKQSELKASYDAMINDAVFSELFDIFKHSMGNVDQDLLNLQPKVSALSDDDVTKLMDLGRQFFTHLNSANGIFNFAQKYSNEQFPKFFKIVRNIVKSDHKARTALDFEISGIEGYLVDDIIDDIEDKTLNPKSKRKASDKKESDDVDDEDRLSQLKKKIAKFNEYNEMTELLLSQTDDAICKILTEIMVLFESKKGQGGQRSNVLINHIKSHPYSPNYDYFINTTNFLIRTFKREDVFIAEHEERIKSMLNYLKEFYYDELKNLVQSGE